LVAEHDRKPINHPFVAVDHDVDEATKPGGNPEPVGPVAEACAAGASSELAARIAAAVRTARRPVVTRVVSIRRSPLGWCP
jgi:hypothetical protein